MGTTYGPAQLNPEEWETLGFFYQGPSEDEARTYKQDHAHLDRELTRIFGTDVDIWTDVVFHDNGGCASCGTYFFHGAVVHATSGTLKGDVIAIGGICAETWSLGSELEMRRKRARQARLAAETRAAHAESRAKQLADNPGLEEALETEHRIVEDISRKFRRYGSLSERQIALVFKIQREEREREQRAQEREEKLEQAGPLAEGRYQITGTIISLRWEENRYSYYGEKTLKGLTQFDNGNRVWGTIPRMIEEDVEKGARVIFTATVERSKDDEHFGFYKRPSKASVMAPTG